MNVVKIMGGLGNQLFQYAFARSLGGDVGLDVSYYTSNYNNRPDIAHRDYRLPCFVDSIVYGTEKGHERVNQWEYDRNREYKDCHFFGDWQKMSFFDGLGLNIKLKDECISELAKIWAEQMREENSVAIHIRRTDYINLGWMLGMDYYERAEKLIREKVKNPQIYVFCDDKLLIVPYRDKTFIHLSELDDFYLMTQCKHNIIANSTYSFWAAYLNENENIVIYPADWKCPSPVDIQKERWIAV